MDIPEEVEVFVDLLADAIMERIADLMDNRVCEECPIRLVNANDKV